MLGRPNPPSPLVSVAAILSRSKAAETAFKSQKSPFSPSYILFFLDECLEFSPKLPTFAAYNLVFLVNGTLSAHAMLATLGACTLSARRMRGVFSGCIVSAEKMRFALLSNLSTGRPNELLAVGGHFLGLRCTCCFCVGHFLGRGMRVRGGAALCRPEEGTKTLKQTFHEARGGGGVLIGFHVVGR